jgi:hypothetical protein
MWSSQETDVFYIDDVTISSGQLPPSTPSPPYLSGPTYFYNQTDGTYNSVEWHLWYPQSYPNNPPLIIASPGMGDAISDIPYSEIVPYGYAVLGFSGSDSFANWSVCISNYSAALTTLIDWVFSSSFPYSVDKNNVGLYGFSCGGGAVLTINDTRIHAIVADCPAYVTGICAKNKVPVLITTANDDIECPYSTNGYLYYSALSPPKMIIQIAGGTHQDDAGMNYSLSWYYWLLKSQTSGLNYINNVNTNPNIVVWETTLPLVAPTVTATPATIEQGQSSNLTSTPMTSGVPPYSYQWFEKGPTDPSYSLISGANLSNYEFVTSDATATGTWSFILQVTDSTAATVNCTAVTVTVSTTLVAPTVTATPHLLLTAQPDQATYSGGQTVTFTIDVLNQLCPALTSTLTLTVTGPNGYYYYDFQSINVTANSVNEYSFTWNTPNAAGTYVVEVSLIPAQLTAYDAVWLQVV